MKKVTHRDVVSALERIVPPTLAEGWDNTGLLVDPGDGIAISRILLAIDCTEPVLEEAIRLKCSMVVAYHPLLFSPIKALRWGVPGERVVMKAIARKIAIYSPHTCLDAVEGGVNDWLAMGLGEGCCTPMDPSYGEKAMKLVLFVPQSGVDSLAGALSEAGAGIIGSYTHCSFGVAGKGTFSGGEDSSPAVGRKGRLESVEEIRLEMVCPEELIPRLDGIIRAAHPYEEPAWELYPLERKPLAGTGQGRSLVLNKGVTVATLIRRLKRHLGTKWIRVASPSGLGKEREIRRIAICAGAGGSLFKGVSGYDLYFTGEMQHHDVLEKVAQGATVVLAGHTETERGYLPILGERLGREVGASVDLFLSEEDQPPLERV